MAFAALEKNLGYVFKDKGLLQTALTHRSHGNCHNERLEFLGDGVLNCAIAGVLFERFPTLPEGDLSRLRAHLVRQEPLHQLALHLHLGEYLRLGEGEMRSGGHQRPSILADAVEALFGAVYLESGFDAAARLIQALFASQLAALVPGQSMKDPKTRLQEWLQGRHKSLPRYQLLETSGAAHDQRFHVACQLDDLGIITQGMGATRRLAEQAAAEKALEKLNS
ncbi:MAG: ribonuclease III [Azovibrio sp.]|uniref:ribonuclease III n=1 Tax=Azovibrio sp. TaxID=1872673 RepID=UPI003C73997F